MALSVAEVMNRELLSVHAGDAADSVLAAILGAGVTAASVVDEARRPIGIVSWRDLLLGDDREVIAIAGGDGAFAETGGLQVGDHRR